MRSKISIDEYIDGFPTEIQKAIFLLVVLFFGCESATSEHQLDQYHESGKGVMARSVTKEIAGSNHVDHATAYTIIDGDDTLEYEVIFSERKDGAVWLDMNIPHQPGMIFQERMDLLENILPTVGIDFRLDSLRTIIIGRLIKTGDLAVDVTKDYFQEMGPPSMVPTEKYGQVSNYLLDSPLTRTYDKLLNPYGLEVSKVHVEKVFFTSRESLLGAVSISEEAEYIPEQILDAQIVLSIKKE